MLKLKLTGDKPGGSSSLHFQKHNTLNQRQEGDSKPEAHSLIQG